MACPKKPKIFHSTIFCTCNILAIPYRRNWLIIFIINHKKACATAMRCFYECAPRGTEFCWVGPNLSTKFGPRGPHFTVDHFRPLTNKNLHTRDACICMAFADTHRVARRIKRRNTPAQNSGVTYINFHSRDASQDILVWKSRRSVSEIIVIIGYIYCLHKHYLNRINY